MRNADDPLHQLNAVLDQHRFFLNSDVDADWSAKTPVGDRDGQTDMAAREAASSSAFKIWWPIGPNGAREDSPEQAAKMPTALFP